MEKKLDFTHAQVDALLDRLSSDDAFRDLFIADLSTAIAQLPGPSISLPQIPIGACLRPRQLASKECIAASRAILAEKLLSASVLKIFMFEEHSLNMTEGARSLAA